MIVFLPTIQSFRLITKAEGDTSLRSASFVSVLFAYKNLAAPPRRRSCSAPHAKILSLVRRSVIPALYARLYLRCLRRLPFFLRRKKGRKERRQNQGFGILSAAEVPPASVPFSHATAALCKFLTLLSHSLCVSIRDALCACAGWPDRGTLRVCRAAA